MKTLKLLLICLTLTVMAACGTPNTPIVDPAPAPNDSPVVLAGKSLLAAKSTIVVAATSIDQLCHNGTMTAQQCIQAKNAYQTAQTAYDAAVDAYLLFQAGSGTQEEFQRALSHLNGLATSLLILSGDLK